MTENEMEIAMYKAMYDIMGPGYVQSYYEDLAAGFIGVAKQYQATGVPTGGKVVCDNTLNFD